MSRIIPSTSLFYDAFTSDAGGGVRYLNGNIIDRVKRITNVEFSWDLQNAAAEFIASSKTISMTNQYDNRTFPGQKFQVNDLFDVVGTSSNDGSYTIAEISEDGKIITTVESLVDETADNASFHGTTPITALNLFYNIIPNGGAEDYTSLVDPFSKQKFIVTGIDCEVATPEFFAIGTKSYAWVTVNVSDAHAGKSNAVYVIGTGLANYIQSFRIVQYFTVTPFYLNSQFYNFQNLVPPDNYFGGKSVKYICRVEGMFVAGNPVADHSVSDLGVNGTGSWYNEAALGSLGEYSITSVVYQDNETSDPLERLDITKNCLVTITVNSRNGKFVDAGSDTDSTMFILGFHTNPSSESDYQDTPTTQRENFFQDSCTNYIGAAAENGLQFGTGYQSITACRGVIVSPNVFTVTFVFDAGTTFANYWKSKLNGDRYYTISLITQGVEYTTTVGTDRMTLLCDWQSADYETKRTDLFSFISDGLEAFKYPDVGNAPRGSIEGFQGDPFYSQIRFRIPQHNGTPDICTVKNIKWEIVGEKSGSADFVFEQKIIDFSQAKKLLSVQQLDYFDTRGFITYEGDPANEVTVSRDISNDTETESAYTATYGLILRYESWINALNQFQFTGTEIGIADIAKDIDSITQDWSAYDNIESWNLFLRFSCSVVSEEVDSVNIYRVQIPVVVNTDDKIVWGGSTPPTSITLQYFTQDESEELKSVDRNSITLIRATLNGNFPLGSDDDSYYGQMFSTMENGSVFDRRLASSEIPSEPTSPWSPTPVDVTADFSWAFGNLRFNIYASRMTVDGYFDSSIYTDPLKGAMQLPSIDIRARFGTYKTTSSSS